MLAFIVLLHNVGYLLGQVGSLLYLTVSRLDISFNVGAYVRDQVAPKESHRKLAKRNIRYVHWILDFGLWYPFGTTSKIVVYSNADWADDVKYRKCTSEGYFYIDNNLVSWHSKKQNSISLSTTEVEYVVACSG